MSANINIRPLHDRVVIQRVEQEKKTPGGIVIPDTASGEKPSEGQVIAVGPGKRSESGQVQPMGVKVGDKVLFGKYAGSEVKIGGRDYIILSESDVIGVLA